MGQQEDFPGVEPPLETIRHSGVKVSELTIISHTKKVLSLSLKKGTFMSKMSTFFSNFPGSSCDGFASVFCRTGLIISPVIKSLLFIATSGEKIAKVPESFFLTHKRKSFF